eukprot:1157418-Prorocentrum_minimum.AAC.4
MADNNPSSETRPANRMLPTATPTEPTTMPPAERTVLCGGAGGPDEAHLQDLLVLHLPGHPRAASQPGGLRHLDDVLRHPPAHARAAGEHSTIRAVLGFAAWNVELTPCGRGLPLCMWNSPPNGGVRRSECGIHPLAVGLATS